MTEGQTTLREGRAERLLEGRRALERQAWGEAYAYLSEADRDAPLDPGDLESLAVAARLLGREAEAEPLLERAHHGFLGGGDIQQAVRCAFWLTMLLFQRGAMAPAAGWMARAQRLLEESRLECVEQGYMLLPQALRALAEGDAAGAYAAFQQSSKIAERFDDADLLALTRVGRGQGLIQLGEIHEASALFDEAMAAVTAGDISPVVVGIVFCGIIDACIQIFDVGRAQQWTVALSTWCDSQPEMVLYRGQCLVYRAEIMQLRGSWDDALEQARLACERLSSPLRVPEAGEAFYRLGELLRMRGEFPQAEDAYRQASKLGREPQPGLAQLRLAEGKRNIALTAIQRVVGETRERSARCKALAAGIEIMLAVGDIPSARAAANELAGAGADFDSLWLDGLTEHALGAVLLAEGDPQGALEFLRRAEKTWQELETPYEAARERVLIALACRQLGDEDSAEIEFDAARWAFGELGAAPDIARVDALALKAPGKAPGSLTLRETQVLRSVAAGKTNRAIAETLFISEKTVDRHVSNVFAKLGVSSRAAATAFAYERGLLDR